MVKASELSQALGGKLIGADFIIGAVCIDTRILNAGETFIALNGQNVRGIQFLKSALEKGAIGAIVDEHQDLNIAQIIVPDVLKALRTLAEIKRNKSEAQFIGITGSNGKTSTKEMTAFILDFIGKTYATKGNYNNDIGVPITLASLAGDEEFVVVEMGANHLGEIAELCAIASPDVGLITNIAPAHLAGFGSVMGVIETKEALYDSAKIIVQNLDVYPEALQRWTERYENKEKITYSIARPEALLKLNEQTNKRFTVSDGETAVTIEWGLYGAHNINNALAVGGILKALHLDLNYLQALNAFEMKAKGRLAIHRYEDHIIFDDSYNANPASFMAGFEVLNEHHHHRKIVFAGGMGELGEQSEKFHADVLNWAEEDLIEFYPVETSAYGVPSMSKSQASGHILDLLQQDVPCAILLKGSRSAKMEELLTPEIKALLAK